MTRWLFPTTLVLACGTAAQSAEKAVRFERDVRPVLVRCVTCHGPGKMRAGLRLDGREAATQELDSGNRAVVPGKPDQSELLRRVASTDPQERMPPRGEPLTTAQVDSLRRWIASGAEWPEHWAYRPLARPVSSPTSPSTACPRPRPPTNARSCAASSST
jgi:hypothetical protein